MEITTVTITSIPQRTFSYGVVEDHFFTSSHVSQLALLSERHVEDRSRLTHPVPVSTSEGFVWNLAMIQRTNRAR